MAEQNTQLPKMDLDHEADVGYIRISWNRVTKRRSIDDGLLYFDFDADEQLVGVEILSLTTLVRRYNANQGRSVESIIDYSILPTLILPQAVHACHCH